MYAVLTECKVDLLNTYKKVGTCCFYIINIDCWYGLGELQTTPKVESHRNRDLAHEQVNKLTGKVAVITGGGTGIGLATAQRFVREGAHVFIVGRRQAELDKAKSLIGDGVTAVQGDVTRFEDLDRLVKTVAAEKGVVDIIVSNAAIAEQGGIDSLTPEHFDTVFNLNARAPVFLVQKFLPLMTGGGSIVLVGSAMHVMGIPGHTAYAATKAV